MVNIGFVTIQDLRHLLEFLQRNTIVGSGWEGEHCTKINPV